MATNTLSVRYQLRHDIESEFTTKNPILLSGEVAIAYTSEGTKVKIGENKAFNDTPYVTDFSKSSISAYGHLLSSLTIQYIEQEEYYRLVSTNNGEGIDPNTLYILSGTYSNNFGEQIKNVADPTDEFDAATKNYVDQEIANLSDEYQPKGNYLTSHQSLDNYYTKTQVNALSTTFRNGLVESGVLDSYAKYIPGNTVTDASLGNKEYSVYIYFNFLDGGLATNVTLYPLKTRYRNLCRSWYSHFDRPDFGANIEFTLDENDVSDGKLRLIVNSLGGSLTFDNVDFLENANITLNDILHDSFEYTYVDSNYGRIQFRINYILDDTYAYYSAYSYSKDVIEKKINDAVLSSTENSTPLAGKTYDLSQNGMFTKLVVDVGRALGATITNSPVDGLLAASIVDGDEMRFGN